MNQKLISCNISQDEIHLYIQLLKDNKQLKTNNYEEILELIRSNFNVEINNKDLDKYFEPTLDELCLDNKLLYSNLGY